jgi:hypothetical protein
MGAAGMSREWAALPRGEFTGIHWDRPGATAGFDPYLVWAEATQFSAQGGQPPRWLSIAIELEPGTDIRSFVAGGQLSWLRVAPVYTAFPMAGLRFCTARVRPGFFSALQPGGPLHRLVRRFELGLALQVPAEDDSAAASEPRDHLPASVAALPLALAREASRPLTGKVLALIDDSLAVAHANLQAAGRPRTAFLWRQDGHGRGRHPVDLGYGHELTAADIQAAMQACTNAEGVVDEAATYVELGLSVLGRSWPTGRVPFHALDLPASHGTHVADIAAGPRTVAARVANLPPDRDAPPTWDAANDEASRCPLIAVQLDTRTVADTSGASMNVALMDALAYVLSRCDARAEIVANLSYGTQAGPHDGTSWLESAMDHLIGLSGGRLQIAVAAGNSYQLRTHANVCLAPGASATLHWRVQPDDRTPSFLELWIEEGRPGIRIEVTPPGGAALPALSVGQSGIWRDGHRMPVATLIYPERVATGTRGTCALLALAPTFSFDAGVATADAGVWRVRLHNTGSVAAVVDGTIERDDVVIASRTGARQSHFEDDPALAVGQQYDLDAFLDDPARATPVRRSGSFSSIAGGSRVVSVGANLLAEPTQWAHYSPTSPDPDAGRPGRPGVVKVPTTVQAGDETRVLHGLTAAGSRSGQVVRLAGTSAAAPQIARRMINGDYRSP